MPEFKNILLVQLGDIGDVVLTAPTIRAVRESYPGARVSILVSKPYGALLAADPNVHDVIETERTRGPLFSRLREFLACAQRLRRAHYDLVIDLRTGDRGAILSFFTRAPTRVGRQGIDKQFWHEFLFTRIVRDLKKGPPSVHPGADQSLSVVRELGIDTADSTPRLYIAPAERLRAGALIENAGIPPGTNIVTVNPFSRWKYKEWDNLKWGKVIDRIWDAHRIPALLVGAPEDAAASGEIIAGREGRTFNLAGATTLSELAAVLSMSSLHLGVDSAAPHIAAAVGTPTVTLHGPSDWRSWRIVNEYHKVVSQTMDCVPCNMKGCNGSSQSRCLDELAEEPVIHAALNLLQAHLT